MRRFCLGPFSCALSVQCFLSFASILLLQDLSFPVLPVKDADTVLKAFSVHKFQKAVKFSLLMQSFVRTKAKTGWKYDLFFYTFDDIRWVLF